jgi:O-antigen/teichoic acid export membrane protein
MPLLVPRFGLTDYGVYLLASSLSGYFGLMDLGVGASVVKYVAEHRAKKEERALSLVLSTSLFFYVIVGVVATVLLIGVALTAAALFRIPPESVVLTRNLLLLSAAVSLIAWPTSLAGHILMGHQRFDVAAYLSVGMTVGSIVATIAVIMVNQGPFALLAATSAVGIVGALVSVYYASKELSRVPVRLRLANVATFRSIFRFSSVVFVTQVAGVLIYQQTDRVVLGIFVGAAAITLYEAASKIQALVRQLAGMLASAVMPAASQLEAEERSGALESLFLRGTKYSVIFVIPITAGLVVLAEPILRTWLGPQFVPMTFGAQLFVSYWLLNANTTVAGGILTGTGKLRFLLWYTIGGTVANVVLSVILAQRIGVLGVIYGTTIPYFVGFPIYMYYTLKVLRIPAKKWFREVVLRPYPLLIVTVLIAWAGQRLGFTASLTGVAAVGLVSVVAYWALAYFVALNPSERRDFASLLRMFGGRPAAPSEPGF